MFNILQQIAEILKKCLWLNFSATKTTNLKYLKQNILSSKILWRPTILSRDYTDGKPFLKSPRVILTHSHTQIK